MHGKSLPEAPSSHPLPGQGEVQLPDSYHLLAVHVRQGVLPPHEAMPVPAVPPAIVAKLVLVLTQLMHVPQHRQWSWARLQQHVTIFQFYGFKACEVHLVDSDEHTLVLIIDVKAQIEFILRAAMQAQCMSDQAFDDILTQPSTAP